MAAERITLPAHDIWAPGARGESVFYEKSCIGHGLLEGEMAPVAGKDWAGWWDVYRCEQCFQLVPVERSGTNT